MNRLLDDPLVRAFGERLGPAAAKEAVTAALAALRRDLTGGTRPAETGAAVPADATLHDAVVLDAATRLAREERAGLVRVLNATGIVLHTNLGRAPLAPAALAAIGEIAGGYANLEFDLAAGSRGSRYDRLSPLLRRATGAEDALVVNNGAAAVLLVLDTLARGLRGESREVITARGELIEIGGGFRLPEVLARSGATLVEIGTANRVRLDDYAAALSPRTALVLRSHRSNFAISGFTADVDPAALAALGARLRVPVVEDLGGGALSSLAAYGLPDERTVPRAVTDGADLVVFSGDKLLGGPQAGIVAGRAALVARLRANPLLRALRVDKATLAALAATLRLHETAAGRATIPFYAMLGATLPELRARATQLASELAGARVVDLRGYAGGGAAPTVEIPSAGIEFEISASGATALTARLRTGTPPVVARTTARGVVVDLRTIAPADDERLATALRAALG